MSAWKAVWYSVAVLWVMYAVFAPVWFVSFPVGMLLATVSVVVANSRKTEVKPKTYPPKRWAPRK